MTTGGPSVVANPTQQRSFQQPLSADGLNLTPPEAPSVGHSPDFTNGGDRYGGSPGSYGQPGIGQMLPQGNPVGMSPFGVMPSFPMMVG